MAMLKVNLKRNKKIKVVLNVNELNNEVVDFINNIDPIYCEELEIEVNENTIIEEDNFEGNFYDTGYDIPDEDLNLEMIDFEELVDNQIALLVEYFEDLLTKFNKEEFSDFVNLSFIGKTIAGILLETKSAILLNNNISESDIYTIFSKIKSSFTDKLENGFNVKGIDKEVEDLLNSTINKSVEKIDETLNNCEALTEEQIKELECDEERCIEDGAWMSAEAIIENNKKIKDQLQRSRRASKRYNKLVDELSEIDKSNYVFRRCGKR